MRVLLRVEHHRRARDDLNRLVAGEPAHHVEVVDDRVVEDAVRHRRDVVGRRDLRVAARQHQHLRAPDLASAHGVMQRAMAGVVAAVETDVERHLRLGHDASAIVHALHVEIDRLLAEDRLARARGALDDRRVRARRRADQHGAHGGIGERLVELRRESRAMLVRERAARCLVQVNHPREPGIGVRRDVRGVHRADEACADEREVQHAATSMPAERAASPRLWNPMRAYVRGCAFAGSCSASTTSHPA